jgi:hypothetical protein
MAMGKSQTMFAVEVLEMAISSVGRFETSTEPPGDVLLKLARISDREALNDDRGTEERKTFTKLGQTFRGLFLKQALGGPEFESYAAYVFSHGPGRPDINFLFVRPDGEEEDRAARFFHRIFLEGLRNSNDPAARAEVLDALETLQNKVLTQMEKERYGRTPETYRRAGEALIKESHEIVLKSIEGKK